MMKKGQITIFIIIGIVILISVSFLFYVKSSSAKEKSYSAADKAGKSKFETDTIRLYIESCLKQSSDKAFFDRIGLQGGYISPSGSGLSKYYDKGAIEFYTGPGDALTRYDNFDVPFYVDADKSSPIPKEETEKKAARFIFAEFLECINFKPFEEAGFSIITPDTTDILPHLKNDFRDSIFNVKVALNKKDVSVKLYYPVTIAKAGFKAEMSEFAAFLPIALGDIYGYSSRIVDNIRQHGQKPNQYDITADCSMYNINGLTNIYYKPITDSSGVIQFVDFSTFYNNYLQSFVFQFAVKNVNVTGACAG